MTYPIDPAVKAYFQLMGVYTDNLEIKGLIQKEEWTAALKLCWRDFHNDSPEKEERRVVFKALLLAINATLKGTRLLG